MRACVRACGCLLLSSGMACPEPLRAPDSLRCGDWTHVHTVNEGCAPRHIMHGYRPWVQLSCESPTKWDRETETGIASPAGTAPLRELVAVCTLTGRGPPERWWRSAYYVRRASACWNESSGRGQTGRAMCTSTRKSEIYDDEG